MSRRAAPLGYRGALLAAPTLALGAAWAEAWYRRPKPSWDKEGAADFASWLGRSFGESSGLLALARASATSALKWLFFSPYLTRVHTVELLEIERLHAAINNHVRDGGRGLLSVSNHASTFDDPGLMCAGVLPAEAFYTPRKMRWNFCAEKVCFSKGALLAAFFGAGKALPISRKGGLQQPVLKTTARMLASGLHVHIYPEGRVWQERAHARDEHGRWSTANGKRFGKPLAKLGPLHRGVGNLFASAVDARLGEARRVAAEAEAEAARGPQPQSRSATRSATPAPLDTAQLPMILPFYHVGMDNILPIEADGRPAKGLNALRARAKGEPPVVVKVGSEIAVSDLVRTYEVAVGAATTRRDGAAAGAAAAADAGATAARLALVDGVVARIEAALLELEGEVRSLARERGTEASYGIPQKSTRAEWDAAQARYAALFAGREQRARAREQAQASTQQE